MKGLFATYVRLVFRLIHVYRPAVPKYAVMPEWEYMFDVWPGGTCLEAEGHAVVCSGYPVRKVTRGGEGLIRKDVP